MRAMTVVPGALGSASVTDIAAAPGAGSVLVEGVLAGICGTDAEIVLGHHGVAPPGSPYLVLGHESLGRVVDAPPGCGLEPGDLVAGIVRRPDPEPCEACAAGAWDMCRNGLYTERGIRALHGFGAEQWCIEPEFAVKVPDALGDAGVLVEPASIVAKAWEHITHISRRSPLRPRRVLVTGAGPIGLLAALIGVQSDLEVHVLDRNTTGPKPDLVADLGATYHSGSPAGVPAPDVVVECTGASSVVVDVIGRNAPGAIVCLTGVSGPGRRELVDVGEANRRIVLENDVVFGTVNANRAHYEAAVAALQAADLKWLDRLITRRVPLGSWIDGLERNPEDVKVVVDLTAL